jgi:hypothetical protein
MKEEGVRVTHKDIGRGTGPTFAQIMKAIKEEVFSDYEEDIMVDKPTMNEPTVDKPEDEQQEVEDTVAEEQGGTNHVDTEPVVEDLLRAKVIRKPRTKHCTTSGEKRQRSDAGINNSFDYCNKISEASILENVQPLNTIYPTTSEPEYINVSSSSSDSDSSDSMYNEIMAGFA